MSQRTVGAKKTPIRPEHRMYLNHTSNIALVLMITYPNIYEALKPGAKGVIAQECDTIPGSTADIANTLTVLLAGIKANLKPHEVINALNERWCLTLVSCGTHPTFNASKESIENAIKKRWPTWLVRSKNAKKILNIQSKTREAQQEAA